MLSRSLSDYQSQTLNFVIQVSLSGIVNSFTNSLNRSFRLRLIVVIVFIVVIVVTVVVVVIAVFADIVFIVFIVVMVVIVTLKSKVWITDSLT